MIIACPACRIRFETDADSLLPSGRRTRCGQCGHTWFQEPIPTSALQEPLLEVADAVLVREPGPSAEPFLDQGSLEDSAATEVDEPMADAGESTGASMEMEGIGDVISEVVDSDEEIFPDDRVMPDGDEEDSINIDLESPSVADDDLEREPEPPFDHNINNDIDDELDDADIDRELAELTSPPIGVHASQADGGRGKRIAFFVLWLFLAAGIVGGLVSGVLYREAVMAAYPKSAMFYQMVGLAKEPPGAGLAIENIRAERGVENGNPTLIIHADIANISREGRDIPPLQAALTAADGKELQQWTFDLKQQSLMPGEMIPFKTVTVNPPSDAVGLSITFLPEPEPDPVPGIKPEGAGSADSPGSGGGDSTEPPMPDAAY